MKIARKEKGFDPITITIENEDDMKELLVTIFVSPIFNYTPSIANMYNTLIDFYEIDDPTDIVKPYMPSKNELKKEMNRIMPYIKED